MALRRDGPFRNGRPQVEPKTCGQTVEESVEICGNLCENPPPKPILFSLQATT